MDVFFLWAITPLNCIGMTWNLDNKRKSGLIHIELKLRFCALEYKNDVWLNKLQWDRTIPLHHSGAVEL